MISLVGSPLAATIANGILTIDYEHHEAVILIEYGIINDIPDEEYKEAARMVMETLSDKSVVICY